MNNRCRSVFLALQRLVYVATLGYRSCLVFVTPPGQPHERSTDSWRVSLLEPIEPCEYYNIPILNLLSTLASRSTCTQTYYQASHPFNSGRILINRQSSFEQINLEFCRDMLGIVCTSPSHWLQSAYLCKKRSAQTAMNKEMIVTP
jgi:hypothetical protein